MKTKFITFKGKKEKVLLIIEAQIYLIKGDYVSITHEDVYSVARSEYYAPDNMSDYLP